MVGTRIDYAASLEIIAALTLQLRAISVSSSPLSRRASASFRELVEAERRWLRRVFAPLATSRNTFLHLDG